MLLGYHDTDWELTEVSQYPIFTISNDFTVANSISEPIILSQNGHNKPLVTKYVVTITKKHCIIKSVVQKKSIEWARINRELLALLDELMQWLIGKENVLADLEKEDIPDDLEVVRGLINEHQEFMDGLSVRQPEVDAVCKPMRPKSNAPSSRRTSKLGSRAPG